MPLIRVAVVLIVVGFLLWRVNRCLPMAGSIKIVLNAVVDNIVDVWLLTLRGILSQFPAVDLRGFILSTLYPQGGNR